MEEQWYEYEYVNVDGEVMRGAFSGNYNDFTNDIFERNSSVKEINLKPLYGDSTVTYTIRKV